MPQHYISKALIHKLIIGEKKMKKLFTVVAVALLFLTSSSIYAQGIKIGGGLSYGSEIGSIGIRADGVYTINSDFSAAATITYYLEKDYLTWFVVDANAHYNYIKESDMTVYALAGLNMTFWSLSFGDESFGGFGFDASGTDTGINIGTGARKKLSDKIELYGEAKYVLGGGNFFSLGAAYYSLFK